MAKATLRDLLVADRFREKVLGNLRFGWFVGGSTSLRGSDRARVEAAPCRHMVGRLHATSARASWPRR